MMCVTTVQIDPKIGAIVTGRLFSGSVTTEDEVYLVDAEKEYRIQQVSIYMGAFREVVDKVTAGNIVALSGLDLARVGETLIDARHKGNVVPFEQMKYVSEPVMSIVAEPRNPRDMQKLIDAIERLSIEDPNLTVILDEETGQYLLSGMGELHLEVVTKFLAEYAGQVELATTAPMVAYRESISDQGKVVMTKSSNKKNSFRVQTEPLTQEMTELTRKDEPVNEKLARKMALEKDTLWASDRNRNILVDATENVQNLDEAKESIISGFYWACKAGPLCGEPLRGVKVKLIDAQIHKDPTQREPTQISRAVSRAILGALLTARPVLLEPIYKIEISVPIQWLGICSNILARRRGKISSTEQNDSLMVITGFIPVAETFGLSAEMRSATSGCAFWQNTFSQWRKIPDDIAIEIIRQLRTKKGLPAEIPKPSKFVDEA
jgi:elongation factor 2